MSISSFTTFELTPDPADEFTFCESPDDALFLYRVYDVNENTDEVYFTYSAKWSEMKGTLSKPISVSGKNYGFIGFRRKVKDTQTGRFFLYELK